MVGGIDLLGDRLPLPASAVLPRRPFVGAGMEMLIGGVILLVLSGLTGEFGGHRRVQFSRASVLAVAYLIVFGSWIGFTSYLWLLRNARTSLVATYAYVTPVGAVLLGAIVLGEAIAARTVVAGSADRRRRRDRSSARAARHERPKRARMPGSDAREERGAELEAKVPLEGARGAEEHGLAEGGRGELQADGEPA